MSELPSAIFLIADGDEFRFARFYIVCEEVPLGTPESPPIVSGVSDMHPADCQNVEETRNLMQTFSWKKCSHFSPTNIPSAFSSEIPLCNLLIILLIKPKYDMLIAAVPFIFRIPDQIRDYTYKSYCGRDRPESSEVPRRSAGSEQSPADVKSGSGRRPPDP